MKNLIILMAAWIANSLSPLNFAEAAGPEQLNEGKATLRGDVNEGNLDKALTLLKSAAESMPDSVDAQLTLAECLMKLGQIDEAVAQYRKVLKLSPDHRQAKQIVEALAGKKTTVEQQLSVARELIDSGALSQASSILGHLAKQPLDTKQRESVKLMRAEAILWSNPPTDTVQPGYTTLEALPLAMQLIKESKDDAILKPARVIAALVLPASERATATKLISEAGELESAWAQRAQILTLADRLKNSAQAAEASRNIAQILASIPNGAYRLRLLIDLQGLTHAAVERELISRDLAGALTVAWPMIGTGPVPTAKAVLQPVELKGGWLLAEASGSNQMVSSAVDLLKKTGMSEVEELGNDASLLGFWLAAETARQAAGVNTETLLGVAQAVGACSVPSPNRKPGDVLSRADVLQRSILLETVGYISAKAPNVGGSLDNTVDQILAQITRYEKADDSETGLKQFVIVTPNPEGAPSVRLVDGLDRMPRNAVYNKLLQQLTGAYATLGKKEFEKADKALHADANRSLNQFDQIALILSNRHLQFDHSTFDSEATVYEITARYVAKHSWHAAYQAWQLYYLGHPGSDLAWASISLKTQQAEYEDGQRLAAQRSLGDELPPLIVEAIQDVMALLDSDRSKEARTRAIQVVGALVGRYATLYRWDLAEAVLGTVEKSDDTNSLADWALWSRAKLLARRSGIALQSYTAPTDSDEKPLALHELHKAEIALIQQLLKEHATSPYRGPAVQRIRQLAGEYQNYRSFDVARSILVDFLKEQPNLSSGPEIELEVVRVDLAKARDAFARRDDTKKPPAELSPQFAAATESIAAYLKKHPTGHLAKAAEDELFAIGRTFGEVGSWPLVREVLDRFAASVPDYRSPRHLQFLRAVTYLGELDRGYALALLTPQPRGEGQQGDLMPGTSFGLALDSSGAYQTTNGAPSSQLQPQGGGLGGSLANNQPNANPVITSGPQPSSAAPNGATPGFDPSTGDAPSQPSETALAMIRQSQRRQYQQIAMLERQRHQGDVTNASQQGAQQQESNIAQSIALPTGTLLSEEEMKRQSTAADQAYKILVQIVKDAPPDEGSIARQSRSQILWLFGFFEGQMRFDQAIARIGQYLEDRPDDPARVALAYQAINDQLSQAGRRQSSDRITLAWLDQRHKLFDEAREAIKEFIAEFKEQKDWIHRARLLIASSFEQEADLASRASVVRSGGLLVRSGEVLLALPEIAPDHAEVANVPRRIWGLADRLRGLQQPSQAIYLLSQIPIQFPTDPLASQAVLRIAEIHAAGLADPLKAVETYQEYLNTDGDNQNIRSQIFSIGQQLAAKRRFLEALHVFGVFVDSFPTDTRAPEALREIGQTHQANEAWKEAIVSYDRIIDEYPNSTIVPDVKLATAECQINLSQWREARRLYEQFLQQYPKHGQAAVAQSRLGVLKNLERYQKLIADAEVSRNKDDAQFQIGRIVLEQLDNKVKAVSEFRKVVAEFPKSDVADDAQLEIGKALLGLQRLDEAREALLEVPRNFPNSPVADDALYLLGQSYEQQAVRLASVTVEKARQEAFVREQQQAYKYFSKQLEVQDKERSGRRAQLKGEGKSQALALDEASEAFRIAGANYGAISNTSRQAELHAETESALEVANRQDRINEAYRQAVNQYVRAASDYPLGDRTDDSLLRVAQILEVNLKDRAAAMQTYQKIVGLFPGTPVAQDAAWKVAQFYEQEGKFAAAAKAYRDFIRNYPGSPRVADAQFALAEVFEQLGQWVDAMDAYETFRQKFGKHPKAQVAVEQINWIKAYRK